MYARTPRDRRSDEREESNLPAVNSDVAPTEHCAGALGRVKGSLAALAACAPLTRPARPQRVSNCRSDQTQSEYCGVRCAVIIQDSIA